MKAYHFVGPALRDGRPVPENGVWLVHSGPVVLCKTGLHASKHPADALKYAPGSIICLVDVRKDILEEQDKVVGRERKILKRFDCTSLLNEYSRWCALQVIELWNAPEVVKQYLHTGDVSLRSAAESAALNAARSAALNAAESAATSAVWSAARSAAESAATSAQRDRFKKMVDAEFKKIS